MGCHLIFVYLLLVIRLSHSLIVDTGSLERQLIKVGAHEVVRDQKKMGRPITAVHFHSHGVLPKDLALLRCLPELDTLKLTSCCVTDEHLGAIADFPNLQHLSLFNTPVTDQSLRKIAKLKQLRTIDITKTKITDEGLKALENCDRLQSLAIGLNKINGTGLAHITGLPIQELFLSLVDISPKAMTSIAKMKHLKSLHLEFCSITDNDTKFLTDLTSLEKLDLRGNKISDKSILILIAIPKLKEVNVEFTQISVQGIEKLKAIRPDLRVVD